MDDFEIAQEALLLARETLVDAARLFGGPVRAEFELLNDTLYRMRAIAEHP